MFWRGALIVTGIIFFGTMVVWPNNARAAYQGEINIFLPGANADINLAKNFENELKVKFTSLKWYQDWGEAIDINVAKRFHQAGYIPELTWQPQNVSNQSVVNGQWDWFLEQSVNLVGSLPFDIRVSLAPEMNSDWVSWGMGVNGNNNLNHQEFWRYTINFFRTRGVNNIKWIWAPNVTPSNAQYSFSQLYPGDAWVDYLGLDGYNWGTSQPWSRWQSFREVFQSSYNELTDLSSKPILIMETASAEVGGSKPLWIEDMFLELTKMSRIKGFTWFNINKETDWRINSSAESQRSFSLSARGISNSQVSNSTSNSKSSQLKPVQRQDNSLSERSSTSINQPSYQEESVKTKTVQPTVIPVEKISGAFIESKNNPLGRYWFYLPVFVVSFFFGLIQFLFLEGMLKRRTVRKKGSVDTIFSNKPVRKYLKA